MAEILDVYTIRKLTHLVYLVFGNHGFKEERVIEKIMASKYPL